MTVYDVRTAVALRDIGCMARLDPEAGPCYDRWGTHMASAPLFLALDDGELDYVRLRARGKHHQLVTDHVWLCPG